MIKHNKLTASVYMALFVVTDIVFAFFLPGDMVVQLHADGSPGLILPTWAALGIVFVIGAAAAFQIYKKQKYDEIRYWLYAAIIIYVLDIVIIAFNL